MSFFMRYASNKTGTKKLFLAYQVYNVVVQSTVGMTAHGETTSAPLSGILGTICCGFRVLMVVTHMDF